MSAALITNLRERIGQALTPNRGEPLAILYRRGHVAVTREGGFAFYRIADADWTGRPAAEHDALIFDEAQRIAETAGTRVWLRGTAEPFPTLAYLDALDAGAARRPEDTPGARSWAQLKAGAALCLTVHGAARARTYVGVRFTRTRIPRELLPEVVGDELVRIAHSTAAPLREALRDVDAIVARAGWEATPLTDAELGWLMDRSMHTGLDPADVDSDAGVNATKVPFAPTVVLHPTVDGVHAERHVRCMYASIEDRDTEDKLPWMAWLTSRAGVEWAACYDVAAGADLVQSVTLRADINENLAGYDRDLGDRVDRGLARAVTRAEHVLDEVSRGAPSVANRGWGQVVVAVSAPTEAEAVDAAKELTAAAARYQGITLTARGGQYESWRRLIPGEPWGDMGHDKVRHSARFAAAGVPNASQAWGDVVGYPLGPVYGSQIDVAVFDTHGFNRHNKPGGLLLAGRQGGAKTATALRLADWEVAHGRPGTAFSPDGMIARIGKARHMRPHFRHFPLTEQKHRGVLQPSILIPEPRWEHFCDDDDPEVALEAARDQARGDRITRTVDALAWLLPYELLSSTRGVRSALRAAVAEGGGEYGIDPWEHVAVLEAGGEVEKEAAKLITAAEHTLAGRLTLPDRHTGVDPAAARLVAFDDALFTCITCPGLTLPQTSDPSTWTDKEYEAVPILSGGAYLSARHLRATRDAGWWIGDEIDIATGGVGPMGNFLMTVLYDIRRYDKLAMMLVKTGTAFQRIDPRAMSLFGSVAVGPMGADAAADFMGPLGLPSGAGWESTIARQKPGEFVWRHWSDRVRALRVEQGWIDPDLRDATDTTPRTVAPTLVTAGGTW